jgi:formylglycine-generating enzyme required for sulfatase activity
MTRLLIFLASLIVFCSCTSSRQPNDKVRDQPKVIVPVPGVLWLKDNIYIDETEVTNLHYTEYFFFIQRTRPDQYASLLPDTLTWITDEFGSPPYSVYYLRHPAYRDYPVVGLSYEQAVKYCDWRTDMVNCMLYNTKLGIKKYRFDSTFNYPKRVKYRLPSKKEWEYAAQAGLDKARYPLGSVSFIDKNGKPLNLTREYYNLFLAPQIPTMRTIRDSTTKPCPTFYVKPYSISKPNKFGLYHMNGNVSEMVQDTFVMGLNFKTTLDGKPLYDKYTLSSCLKMDKPQIWIGFRCVCEILEK